MPRGTVAISSRLSFPRPCKRCRGRHDLARQRLQWPRSVTVRRPTGFPPVAVRLLLAIRKLSAIGMGATRYAPAEWFQLRPTTARRQQWSRWTRRLETAGYLVRITERRRNRVQDVQLTPAGRDWLLQHTGPFCDVDLEGLDLSSIATAGPSNNERVALTLHALKEPECSSNSGPSTASAPTRRTRA